MVCFICEKTQHLGKHISVPDYRCKRLKYKSKLPSVTTIFTGDTNVLKIEMSLKENVNKPLCTIVGWSDCKENLRNRKGTTNLSCYHPRVRKTGKNVAANLLKTKIPNLYLVGDFTILFSCYSTFEIFRILVGT
jgi:hypothetical protein